MVKVGVRKRLQTLKFKERNKKMRLLFLERLDSRTASLPTIINSLRPKLEMVIVNWLGNRQVRARVVQGGKDAKSVVKCVTLQKVSVQIKIDEGSI